MRRFCQLAPGWTSISTSVSSPCSADGFRRAPCGCRFLRLSILGWIQQNLWFSPLIFLHPVGCQPPCFRRESRRGGFQFPFIGIWTRGAVLSRRRATPAETWQLAPGLEVQDFVPQHMERLCKRLALGMDGISLDYLFSQWRLWRLGNAQWDEPTFFVEAMRGPSSDDGRFLRRYGPRICPYPNGFAFDPTPTLG